jgi:hypothetical protein
LRHFAATWARLTRIAFKWAAARLSPRLESTLLHQRLAFPNPSFEFGDERWV